MGPAVGMAAPERVTGGWGLTALSAGGAPVPPGSARGAARPAEQPAARTAHRKDASVGAARVLTFGPPEICSLASATIWLRWCVLVDGTRESGLSARHFGG